MCAHIPAEHPAVHLWKAPESVIRTPGSSLAPLLSLLSVRQKLWVGAIMNPPSSHLPHMLCLSCTIFLLCPVLPSPACLYFSCLLIHLCTAPPSSRPDIYMCVELFVQTHTGYLRTDPVREMKQAEGGRVGWGRWRGVLSVLNSDFTVFHEKLV